MTQHLIFVAPFFMEATVRFLEGAASLPGVQLSLISQDPAERLPKSLRHQLAGHWRVKNGLDPAQIVEAARRLEQELGKAKRMFGPLEQLQVPLAVARKRMGIPGLSVEAAMNFRDKSRMKTVLENSGVPCARHALVGDGESAQAFVAKVGFPVVVKPPAGAGGKSTFRLDHASDLNAYLARFPPDPQRPALCEEFVLGTEYSFDSVMIAGQPVWYSISRYMPSPLEVMENPWIQWCVILPRDVSAPEFTPIVDPAFAGLKALGLETGLSHMEWFRLQDGRIVISEVGARPPGAQFTSLLSYAHNINFYKAWAQLMAFDEFDPPPRRYAVGAAYIRSQGAGRVKCIDGLDEAQRRFGSIIVEAKLPREGQAPSGSYEGDGYVIVRHHDTDVVESALTDIVRTIHVELG